jgi:hypothetical protein
MSADRNRHVEALQATDRVRYARALWFSNEEHHLIEIEQSDWWSLHDKLRDALARCARLEARNRDLKDLVSEMKSELLLRATPPKTVLRSAL